jgi:tripartite-type tricarboxylate transporter receptor subunit TctC
MWRTCAAALAAVVAAPCLAGAQAGPADFYAGKQIKMICSSDVGGGYDVYSRLFARHLSKHLPGRPLVVSSNMPGAAGVTAASYLAHSAARNGTELLMVVQTLPMVQVTQGAKARFDLSAFHWIGNMDESANVFVASRQSNIRTFADVMTQELVVGSTSPNAIGGILPEAANRILGAKFKIIHGYKSGEAIEIAMQRGEVSGRAGASWSAMKALRGSNLRTEEINVLLQAGNRKEPDLMDVPLMTDLARNESERAALAFYSGMTALSRAIATTPETPKERVDLLRKAFDEVLADEDLLAEARKNNLEIRPLSGAALQTLITRMLSMERALIVP